jgi:hypothetical protein
LIAASPAYQICKDALLEMQRIIVYKRSKITRARLVKEAAILSDPQIYSEAHYNELPDAMVIITLELPLSTKHLT